MPELAVGDKAPDFELLDDAGKPVKLSDFRGQPVVLFFYPEDDTPVCTQQACSFRDAFDELEALDAIVLGISPDGVESHRAFKRKFRLPFYLLSDPGNTVSMRYGSYGTKLMYGKEVQGTIRSSIVVDAKGRVASIHRNVRSEGNGARMVEAVRGLNAAP